MWMIWSEGRDGGGSERRMEEEVGDEEAAWLAEGTITGPWLWRDLLQVGQQSKPARLSDRGPSVADGWLPITEAGESPPLPPSHTLRPPPEPLAGDLKKSNLCLLSLLNSSGDDLPIEPKEIYSLWIWVSYIWAPMCRCWVAHSQESHIFIKPGLSWKCHQNQDSFLFSVCFN